MEKCAQLFFISMEVDRSRADGPGWSQRIEEEAVKMTR